MLSQTADRTLAPRVYGKGKKGYNITDEYALKTARNMTDATTMPTPMDYMTLLNKKGIVTIVVDNEYGDTSKITLISAEEELRRVKEAMKKHHTVFMYYVTVCGAAVLLFGFFLSSMISGLFGPLTSTVGVLMSVSGAVGALINWRDWVKKNAV